MTDLIGKFVSSNLQQATLIPKQQYCNYLNLGSNELLSNDLSYLFQQFLASSRAQNINVNQYPYYEDLRETIAQRYGISAHSVAFSAGSDAAIQYILNYLTTDHGNILLQTPNYSNYYRYASINKLNIIRITYGLKDEKAFIEQLIDRLHTDISICVLTTPEGMLGKTITVNQLKQVAKVAQNYQTLLLVDLAYSGFSVYEYHELLKWDNVILLKSFSKHFGMAGLRFNVILGNSDLLYHLRKTGLENCVSEFAKQYVYHLLDNEQTLNQTIKKVVDNRSKLVFWLENNLDNCNQYEAKQGNFFNIYLPGPHKAKQLVSFFKQHNVLIKQMSFFGSDYAHIVRITVPGDERYKHILQLLRDYEDNK